MKNHFVSKFHCKETIKNSIKFNKENPNPM